MNSSSLFLEGTAAIGKTSTLRILESKYKNKVKFSDLNEFKIANSELSSKEILDGYNSTWMFEPFSEPSYLSYNFYDRSPVAIYVYKKIFKTLATKKIEKLPEHLAKYRYPATNGIIIVTTDDIDVQQQVLDNMMKRKNGIDSLTIEYVQLQNHYWREAAKMLDWVLIEVDGKVDDEKVNWMAETFDAICHKKMIMYNAVHPRTNYNDIGIDLTSKDNRVLLPRVTYKMDLNERVLLPRGTGAFIHSRSGLSSLMSTSTGVIDCYYTGQLKSVVRPYTDMKVMKNDRICQLVPRENCPVIFSKFAKPMNVLGRGEKGFGSSGLQAFSN